MSDLPSMKELLDRAYDSGVSDAIEEIAITIKEHKKECEALGVQDTVEWVLEMLERLKEGLEEV